MAFTGTAVYPSTSLYPGTAEYPGQGDQQLLSVLYSTDDASVLLPTWQDATADVRAFSTSRGRATELAEVDAGTATITLNNRLRAYDPAHTTTIRPMNRWWIREQFSGVTESIFKGYAESYDQVWPEPTVTDAVAVVSLVDEFKVLARDKLPVMNPPRDTYKDVIQFDNPQGYWRGDLVLNRISHAPTVGSVEMAVYVGAWGRVASPIVGDYSDLPQTAATPTLLASSLTGYSATTDPSTLLAGLEANGPGDAAGLSAFTFETWFKSSEVAPAAQRLLVTGPASGGVAQWGMTHNTDGGISAYARNSGGTLYTVTVGNVGADQWLHLALVVTGSATLLYVNGVLAGSASFAGVVGTMDAGGFMQLGTSTAVGGTRYYDEWAWYRSALSADRILAHYRAGAQRGFPAQDPGARINAVLDAVGNTANRNIRPGTREMTPAFMRGQSPLDELRRAEHAEAVDAVLFVARDGTFTFLDDGHRSVSPWSVVQASFVPVSDFPAPYTTVDLDYSDSFIANEWNVTKTGGTLTTASDAASISAYGPRPQSLTDLPLTTDADVTSIAAAMLAKYKDPLTRVTSLTFLAHAAFWIETLFGLEIGDKVRVTVDPPGGGSPINQTSYIQRIAVDADPSRPWRVTLGVSPL